MANPLQQAEFRIAVTLKLAKLLRAALEANGNRYSGGLVPNLTSVTDCLTIPFPLLLDQVRNTPEIWPDGPAFAGWALWGKQ